MKPIITNIIVNDAEFHLATPIQLRTTDIDMYMHVNNTRYLDFFDLGKANYFMVATENTWKLSNMLTVIANVNCSFIKSVVYSDEAEVLTRCEKIGEKSFVLHQLLVHPATLEVFAECHTVMVCIDKDTHKSMVMPQTWRDYFCKFEGRSL